MKKLCYLTLAFFFAFMNIMPTQAKADGYIQCEDGTTINAQGGTCYVDIPGQGSGYADCGDVGTILEETNADSSCDVIE